MYRPLLSLFLIILLAIMLLPAYSDTNEIQVKQFILSQDLEQSNQLSRTHTASELSKALQQDNLSDALQKMQRTHPHVLKFEIIKRSGGQQHAQTVGRLPSGILAASQNAKREALQKLPRQSTYQSPDLMHNGDAYFVLGQYAEKHCADVLTYVRQEVLADIEVEQKKNLRMVPYPSDQRFNIQAVDSDTLNQVNVDHPEDNEGTSHYVKDQVIVKFHNEPSEAELTQILRDIQAKNMKNLGYTYVFTSESMQAEQLMKYFDNNDNVQYTEPNFLYLTNTALQNEQNFIPNDELFSKYQWNLPVIQTMRGWSFTRGSDDVVVAVIDTGVDLDHEDLQNQLVPGVNVIEEGAAPMDDVGHGTHVAGIISAIVNNNEGVAGMSWFNKVMPVKVLDHTGAGSTYAVAIGIIWAVDNGAQVINMSLGNYAEAEFLHDAIRYAYDHDVVLVAATGNDNTENPGYPAAYPEVIAVSATNSSGNKAGFSNYGHYVDLVAPGEHIASTYLNNQYAALSGTSMASPHVAALAAMIRSANPLLTNIEIMETLIQTCTDLGPRGKDKYFGYGQIDVAQALSQATQAQRSLSLWPSMLERQLQQLEQLYGS